MEKWEIALDKFINKVKNNSYIIGALVCGSYVTGNPTSHSDIDVHIILSDNVKWRQRGNEIIDGYLIEYFMNPPKQLIKYMEEDYNSNRTMAMVQFITGKVIFDKIGEIKKLKKEAKKWLNKKYKSPNKISLEIQKYGLWDMLDNLQDLYKENAKDFIFSYHNALRELFEKYLKYLKQPITSYYKFHKYLTDEKSRKKYLQQEFPDKGFGKMYVEAITETDLSKMIKHYENLTNHIFNKMGCFEIDGWKIKTPLGL